MDSRGNGLRRSVIPGIVAAVALIAMATVGAGIWKAVRTARIHAATERLRAMYFTEDYEGARFEGAGLVRQFPQASELKAWYLLSNPGSGTATHYDPLEAAQQMVREHPTDPWSWFAMAGTLYLPRVSSEQAKYEKGDLDGLAASAKALAMMPHHPDFI